VVFVFGLEDTTNLPSYEIIKEFSAEMEEASNSAEANQSNIQAVSVNWSTFLRQMEKTIFGRRLFKTENGHIGLGPETMQEGDLVWMICCAKIPYVLRSTGGEEGQFTLIGEAYVHGFVNGEMVEQGLGERLVDIQLV
jgi:hypothetical protein